MTDLLIVGNGQSGAAAAKMAVERKRSVVVLSKPDHEVVAMTLGTSQKKLMTASGKTFEAPAVILALGCRSRRNAIEGEEKFLGSGVHYNAFQDGIQYEGKTVVVEGKNEETIQSVCYLSRFAAKIHLIVPAMRLDVEQRWVVLLQKCPNVEMVLSSSIKKMEGNETIRAVTVLAQGTEKQIDTAGVFLLARRSLPQLEFLKGAIEMTEDGSILVDERFMTSAAGVFCCGDMVAGIPQLPSVSAAQGTLAAMHADAWLAVL